jgi:hypothetical protein
MFLSLLTYSSYFINQCGRLVSDVANRFGDLVPLERVTAFTLQKYHLFGTILRGGRVQPFPRQLG